MTASPPLSTMAALTNHSWPGLFLVLLGFASNLILPAARAQPNPADLASRLSSSLTFHASYNHGIDADFARGNPQLFTLISRNPTWEAKPGLLTDHQTVLVHDAGLSGGGALRFTSHQSRWLFYETKNNLTYQSNNWSGTVSLWLKVDPHKELAPGYCDPIQITPRQWNDAAFFVDFKKDGNPRDFRLGAFADLKVWNSKNENVDDIPENRRPLLPVRNPPFRGDQWTHVLFTWDKFNTGTNDGQAFLHLNGQRHGPLAGWNQQFTWSDQEQCRLLIGLNYIGLFDELACFNRALTPEEVSFLHQHPARLQAPAR